MKVVPGGYEEIGKSRNGWKGNEFEGSKREKQSKRERKRRGIGFSSKGSKAKANKPREREMGERGVGEVFVFFSLLNPNPLLCVFSERESLRIESFLRYSPVHCFLSLCDAGDKERFTRCFGDCTPRAGLWRWRGNGPGRKCGITCSLSDNPRTNPASSYDSRNN